MNATTPVGRHGLHAAEPPEQRESRVLGTIAPFLTSGLLTLLLNPLLERFAEHFPIPTMARAVLER
ncbi:hypothetical protein, partial [Thiorhodococcus mannitoliphagus]|uniref:hypothetical protein n=1 Tax=Thiorhodococcus mannitoliphagus TaxID=329406 RepID=UPI0019822DA7